ncbi:unnamed protein product, partial [Allacma fusca]
MKTFFLLFLLLAGTAAILAQLKSSGSNMGESEIETGTDLGLAREKRFETYIQCRKNYVFYYGRCRPDNFISKLGAM